MDLIEIKSQNVNWIDVADGRVYWRSFVNTVMNPNYLSSVIPMSVKLLKNRHILGVVFTFIQLLFFFSKWKKKNTTYFLKPKCPMAYFPSLSTIQLWFACTKVHRVSSNAVTTDFMVHDSYITIQNLQLAWGFLAIWLVVLSQWEKFHGAWQPHSKGTNFIYIFDVTTVFWPRFGPFTFVHNLLSVSSNLHGSD